MRASGVTQSARQAKDQFRERLQKIASLRTRYRDGVLAECAQLYKRAVDGASSALSTRSSNYSWGISAVRSLLGPTYYPTAATVLRLEPDEFKALKARQHAHSVQANENRTILDGAGYQGLCRALFTLPIGEDRWPEACAALIMATGRRPTEIMKTGHFRVAPGPSQAMLLFSGQLKKRGGHASEYVIPSLVVSAQACVDKHLALRPARQANAHLSNEQVISLVSKAVNNVWTRNRSLLAHYGGQLTSETIRGAYATTCWRVVPGAQELPEAMYMSKILGHANTDYSTAVAHYQRSIVSGWPGAPVPDLFLTPDQVRARAAALSHSHEK